MRRSRQKSRDGVVPRRTLEASFALRGIRPQNAVKGTERAQIVALLQQGGMHLGGRLVTVLRAVKRIAHRLTFLRCQRSGLHATPPRTACSALRLRPVIALPPGIHRTAVDPQNPAGQRQRQIFGSSLKHRHHAVLPRLM